MDKKHKTLEDFKNLKEPVNIIITLKQEPKQLIKSNKVGSGLEGLKRQEDIYK